MRSFRPGLIAASLFLAACLPAGGHFASKKPASPYAPGADIGEDSVDGLIVGHRLMAAGEYDLALQAYYRGAAEHGATVDVLSAIGSADLKLGRLGQAERILRKAITVDERFVPAWNNLGVVLMEKGQVAEASRVFKTAYALDSGQSDEIRDNLRLALAKLENPVYDSLPKEHYSLVRRGYGEYLLLTNL
jgi:tetratricopeptide (TPR) repeat protein